MFNYLRRQCFLGLPVAFRITSGVFHVARTEPISIFPAQKAIPGGKLKLNKYPKLYSSSRDGDVRGRRSWPMPSGPNIRANRPTETCNVANGSCEKIYGIPI
ncbi:hypothetical protein F4782DRAFT_375375 [Xylaria castorea]|nr:hypothetical protein F4782DRAFT_375375 [Xylaria castorea]